VRQIHATDDGSHTRAGDRTDRQPDIVEGLENSEVGEATRPTTSECQDRRPKPPSRARYVFSDSHHGLPPTFQPFVDRLDPRADFFATLFGVALTFGFAVDFFDVLLFAPEPR
jgi:hypothetical protein